MGKKEERSVNILGSKLKLNFQKWVNCYIQKLKTCYWSAVFELIMLISFAQSVSIKGTINKFNQK